MLKREMIEKESETKILYLKNVERTREFAESSMRNWRRKLDTVFMLVSH